MHTLRFQEKRFHWCVLVFSPFFEAFYRNRNCIEKSTGISHSLFIIINISLNCISVKISISFAGVCYLSRYILNTWFSLRRRWFDSSFRDARLHCGQLKRQWFPYGNRIHFTEVNKLLANFFIYFAPHFQLTCGV